MIRGTRKTPAPSISASNFRYSSRTGHFRSMNRQLSVAVPSASSDLRALGLVRGRKELRYKRGVLRVIAIPVSPLELLGV